MSSTSHPQPPGDATGVAQPTTNEIPVVQPAAAPVTKQLPPHPGATAFTAQPATAVGAPQPTGPVDFVPGPPGAGSPPPPAASPMAAAAPGAPGPTWPESLDAHHTDRPHAGTHGLPRDHGALVRGGLAVLALVLLELGLTLDLGTESLWESSVLWAAFATLAALVGLLSVVATSARRGGPKTGQAWTIGAAALVGLAVFWLLVVLPRADSDRGFLLTAPLACLGAALWLGAKRV